MNVVAGRGLPPALQRVVDRLAGELEAVRAPGTVAIGADDSLLPGPGATRPLLVVPACGPGEPTPWGRALVAAADAVALLDAREARDLGGALADRPLLVAGMPRPQSRPEGTGVDPGEAPAPLRDAWSRHGADGSGAGGPGVAWVSGRGLAPLAAALEAWAAGRAVIALPGVARHDLLRRGRALHADTHLEVIEATRFLRGAPALARALGARGREVAAAMPPLGAVAGRLREGAELARQVAAEAR